MSDDEEVKMSEESEEEVEEQEEEEQEEEEEEEEAEQKSTPKKGSKPSDKPSAASTKGSKKSSPNKRKEAPASSSTGGADKKKQKIPEGSAKDTVRTYMRQQNRPYTVLVVYENLHQAIKKPALQKIMDELTEEGDLQIKDFKKVRIYMAKQSDDDVVSPEDLQRLKDEEDKTKDRLDEQTNANKKLENSIRSIANEPSDEELAKQLVTYKKQVDALNAKLARFKNDKNPVTKETINKAQLKFNESLKQWKLRKRAADEIIGTMCGDEGNPKDVIERFRIETDEEAEVKLKDWQDLHKDVKK